MPLDLLKASGSGGPAGLPNERPRVQELLGRDDCSGSSGCPPWAVPGREGLEKEGSEGLTPPPALCSRACASSA
eukprot:scaffold109612_cov60-Phaeocystis_antarctica.AAC.1